mgnify:CR=1 FL=1
MAWLNTVRCCNAQCDGATQRLPHVWMAVALIWVATLPANADFRFDQLGVAEGLSQSRATALSEDSLGRMWVGTEAGLNIYDGYAFRPLPGDDAISQELNSTRIAGVFRNRSDAMWVATGDAVARVSLATNTIDTVRHASLFPDMGISQGDRNATFFAPCREGIWVLRSRAVLFITPGPNGLVEEKALTTRLPDQREPAFGGFSGLVDQQNNLWIADHHRLWRISCDDQTPTLVSTRDRLTNLPVPGGSALALGQDGRVFWASRGRVDVIDPTSDEKPVVGAVQTTTETIKGIAHDDLGQVWVTTSERLGRIERGVADSQSKPLVWTIDPVYRANRPSQRSQVVNRVGLAVANSSDGFVWTHSHFGVVAIDSDHQQAFRLTHDPTREDSLSPIRENQVVTMYADRFGGVWFSGGLTGISRYVPEKNRFAVIKNTDPLSPSARSIEEVIIGGQVYLWVGWDGARLSLWRQGQDNRFGPIAAYQAQADAERVPGQNTVRTMVETTDGFVWMASSSELWRGDTATRQRESMHVFDDHRRAGAAAVFANVGLAYDDQRNELLFSHQDDVWQVALDNDQQIASVKRLDWVSGAEKHTPQTALLKIAAGRYLIGLRNGVRWLDLDRERVIHHPLARSEASKAVGANDDGAHVISLANSPDGAVWVGTRQGLARLELAQSGESVKRLDWWDEGNGLVDDTVYAVGVERANVVWVSTNQGLSRLQWDGDAERDMAQRELKATDYQISAGLPALEFNSRAFDRGQNEQWYFGSVGGIAWFTPEKIKPHPMPPNVISHQVRINDEPVSLQNADSALTLPHEQNNIVIEFSGIHYASTEQNQYAYRLEGHEDQWVMAAPDRVARYANLPPGNYRFWVRAANLDGVWSPPKLLFQAQIRPPWWATSWAYLSYGLLMFGLIALLFLRSLKRSQRLEAIVAERTSELDQKNQLIQSQAKALEESLQARTLFFANISHEFRTPLTLIQTSIDQLEPDNPSSRPKQMANRYLQRLTRLVDQLLDLSRFRLSGVEPADEVWQVNAIVEASVSGFEYLATQRNIDLSFQAVGVYVTRVDQASVEKIILNLLSNALKYTPVNGRVWVRLDHHDDMVAMSFKDTGPGIEADQKEMIFERFERVASAETLLKEGAGIGLALVKEAAAAIAGSVELHSEAGEGSEFIVRFPGQPAQDSSGDGQAVRFLSHTRMALDQAVLAGHDPMAASASDGLDGVDGEAGHLKPVLLVVEDNADLRHELRRLLADQWQVIQAEDGEAGLQALADQEVDVILADLMMPKMDGLALLEAVRDNIETSHIPFLLLSARHDTEARISGLALSADDYLTKPFSPEELKLKLGNVLATRDRMRAFWSQQGLAGSFDQADESFDPAQAKRPNLSPRDHKFLDRLNHWMSDHHSDPEINVQSMADQLSMNERTLQRKIRALMDMTPIQYLNAYRLDKSLEVLDDPSQTIAEVSFVTGFASQQTFARAFKQKYGMTPSQWREQGANRQP